MKRDTIGTRATTWIHDFKWPEQRPKTLKMRKSHIEPDFECREAAAGLKPSPLPPRARVVPNTFHLCGKGVGPEEKVSQEARCLPTQSSELLFYLIYYQIIRTCGVSKREVSHCLVLRTHFHQKFPAKSRRGTLSCMKRAAAEDAAQCAMQARGPEWRASTQPPDKYQNAIRDAKEPEWRRQLRCLRFAVRSTSAAYSESEIRMRSNDVCNVYSLDAASASALVAAPPDLACIFCSKVINLVTPSIIFCTSSTSEKRWLLI